ncbi:MAG: hypothetical protein ABGW86_04745, partial [Candidatus Poseidoniia archaeon]
MEINKRQTLPFVAAILMVVSAFAFTPVSAETSLSADASGLYNNYSFASVNGTAEYTLTLTNDGDSDFTDLLIYPEFQHMSWLAENVSFSDGSTTETVSFQIASLAAGAAQQLTVSVTVGQGVQMDYPEVFMALHVDDGSGARVGTAEVIIVVTNWIAYESNYPSQPTVYDYAIGDKHDYQLTVDNIAVTKNFDNTTSPMAIRDVIQVQFSGISGWTVMSDDETWHPFYGGQLEGMDADYSNTWNISIELTGNVHAGPDVINFQASSTDPDDPMGGMPYFQP